MGRVTVFSLPGCWNCSTVKDALSERNIPFLDINLSAHQEKLKDMVDLVGKRIVPQIFFNDVYIGSVDETIAVLKKWDRDNTYSTALERYEKEIKSHPDPADPRLSLPRSDASAEQSPENRSSSPSVSESMDEKKVFGSKRWEQDVEEIPSIKKSLSPDIEQTEIKNPLVVEPSIAGKKVLSGKEVAEAASPTAGQENGAQSVTNQTCVEPANEPKHVESKMEETMPKEMDAEITTFKSFADVEPVLFEPSRALLGQNISGSSADANIPGTAPLSAIEHKEQPARTTQISDTSGNEPTNSPCNGRPCDEIAQEERPTILTPGRAGASSVSLPEMAKILKQIIPRSNRRHRGRLYKDVFKGSYGVAAIMKYYDLSSEDVAVSFGLSLQKKWNIFDHVTQEHDFGNNAYFFRLKPYEDIVSQSSVGREKLERAAHALRSAVEVKDRRFRIKLYRQCFVGNEVVEFLITKGFARNRAQAVQLGQLMQHRMKLFEHVVNKHGFEDKALFYRFR